MEPFWPEDPGKWKLSKDRTCFWCNRDTSDAPTVSWSGPGHADQRVLILHVECATLLGSRLLAMGQAAAIAAKASGRPSGPPSSVVRTPRMDDGPEPARAEPSDLSRWSPSSQRLRSRVTRR